MQMESSIVQSAKTLFVKPTAEMPTYDLWVLRVAMAIIFVSFAISLIYLRVKKRRKLDKIDTLFVMAFLYSSIVFFISFYKKCVMYSWCYILDLLAIDANGVFHWVVAWTYLKASVEMPFLFKLSLYLEEALIREKIKVQQTRIRHLFWGNIILIALLNLVLVIIEYGPKNYSLYSTILVVGVFFEITIFIITILVALIRIRRTIKDIPELKVNRCLMAMHLALSFIFSILFVIEYIVFVEMGVNPQDKPKRNKILSAIFIMKQFVGLLIYELLLYMIFKIITPLAKSNLKAVLEGTGCEDI